MVDGPEVARSLKKFEASFQTNEGLLNEFNYLYHKQSLLNFCTYSACMYKIVPPP